MRHLAGIDLYDVATLYLGLAKGTDDEFHFRELQKIGDFLERWSGSESKADIVSLLESILHTFQQGVESRIRSVDGAVARLGDALSDEEKRSLLSDLSRIGLADHRFLHAEAAYIQKVADAWDVQMLEGLSDSWSILGEGGIQGEALRALSLLLLSIAYVPDQQIDAREREQILFKMGQWIPDASEEEVELALRDALAVFATHPADELIESSVQTVHRLIPSHQHAAIYEDLKSIARADQIVEVEEKSWLARLGRALGLISE